MEYYSVLKKGNSAIFHNMDKPYRHYTKQNKPVTRKLWFYLYEVLREDEIIELESKMMAVKGWGTGGRNGGWLFNVYRVSVL